jgi:ribonuclease P protein component
MVARALRLTSPVEFERVRATGKSWSTDLVVAVVLENDLAHNRYGFAVGRRIGNAVRRNRAKRLMRESVRNLHPRIRAGYDIVFIARNRVRAETTQRALDRAVEQVIRRAGLLLETQTDAN